MWKKRYAILTTMFVLSELTAAQSNINFSRTNLVLPINRIPAPRPAPSEVQVLEVSTTTAAAIVTESPPMTTQAPIITTRIPGRLQLMAAPRPQPNWQKTLTNPQPTTILSPVTNGEITEDPSKSYDPGYFVSKEQLTGNSEVVSSTAAAINSEPNDPGYFISKEQLTGNTELTSEKVPEGVNVEEKAVIPEEFTSISTELPVPTDLPAETELPISTELPAPTDLPAETELPISRELPVPMELPVSTELPPKTELPITTNEMLFTTSIPIMTSSPLITTLSPSSQNPIVWSMSTPRPFSRPLMVRPSQPTQRPTIMGRTPIFEDDDVVVAEDDDAKVAEAELIPLSKPTLKPVANYKHFEIVDRKENGYPLATTTNIAIYQGPSTMACTHADEYYPLQNECESFVECRKHVATIYMCPDGLFFNNKTIWPHYPCVYPSEVQCIGNKHEPKSSGECPRQYGFFPMPDGDCGKYLMCQEGKATIMECPPGLAFNPEKDSCDWPINVPSCEPDDLKGFDCPEPLRNEDGSPSDLITHFSYHDSCKQYVACQLGHPRLLSCDLGYSYDPRLAYCARTDDVAGCNDVKLA